MSKNNNQRIYSKDIDVLRGVEAEQRDYIGRDTKLDIANGVITIYALPRRMRQSSEKKPRDKRSEKFARRA